MSEKQLSTAVIGLGVGYSHARVLAANPHCRLAVCCDYDEHLLARAQAEFAGVSTTRCAEDVLDDPSIDLVVIASYDNFHYGQACRAIQNSKHVLVEKPVCLGREEAQGLLGHLADNPSVRMSSNLGLRTCPLFARVRQAIAAGEVGDVFALEGDYLWGRKSKLLHGWRTEMDFYSIIFGAAIHMVDLLAWMRGELPVEVQALGNRISMAGGALRYNDYASLQLRFEDGCVGRVTASGGCVHPHFHQLAVFGSRKTFQHRLSGTEWIERDGSGYSRTPCPEAYPARERRADLVDSFVRSILSGTDCAMVNQNDVFSVYSICLAAEEAMRTTRPVTVDYLQSHA